jgi:hypothetical protein
MSQIDLEIKQGATFRASIYYKDSSGPINLVGKTARMQIRAGYDSSTQLYADLTSVPPYTIYGDISITPIDGGIHLHIPDEVTSSFTWKIGQYDLFVLDENQPSGDVELVSSGKVTLIKSVLAI